MDSKNLFVGRIAHQVFNESSAGLIFTHGDPRGDGDNSLVGVDFQLRQQQPARRKTPVALNAWWKSADSRRQIAGLDHELTAGSWGHLSRRRTRAYAPWTLDK